MVFEFNALEIAMVIHFAGMLLIALGLVKFAAMVKRYMIRDGRKHFLPKTKFGLFTFLIVIGAVSYFFLSFAFALLVLFKLPSNDITPRFLASLFVTAGSVCVFYGTFKFYKIYLKERKKGKALKGKT